MKFLLVAALFCASVFADKDVMLQKNRIPVDTVTSVGTTCDECQSLVKRFVLAAHDPVKMRELKMLLNVLCHETSYVDECRVFVNNIDALIKKLEPYLKDYKKVCHSIHLCSNNKLDAFRRIGMLYVKRTMDKVEGMKDLVCDECQLAANEVKSLVEDKEKQKEVQEFFSKQVCIHAGSYRGMCDMLVEQFLPEFFQELDVILKDTKKACADLGFCPAVSSPARLQLPAHGKVHPLHAFWRKANAVKTSNGQELAVTCLECKVAADELLVQLENDRNAISATFTNFVCKDILPDNFTASCEDFLSMYFPTVWYMTVKQFSGEGICTDLHHCDDATIKNLALVAPVEKKQLLCNSCPIMQTYVHQNVESAEMRAIGIAMVQDNFCEPLPGIFHNLCFSVAEQMVPKLLTKWAKVAGENLFCSNLPC